MHVEQLARADTMLARPAGDTILPMPVRTSHAPAPPFLSSQAPAVLLTKQRIGTVTAFAT